MPAPERITSPRMGVAGTLFLHLGVVIAVAAFIDSMDGIPFPTPPAWNNHLGVWFLIGLTMSILGIVWLRRSEPAQNDDLDDDFEV